LRFDLEKIKTQDIIGYAIGEYIYHQENDLSSRQRKRVESNELEAGNICYEIVTAWVDENYRNLNISNQMYLEVMSHVGSV